MTSWFTGGNGNSPSRGGNGDNSTRRPIYSDPFCGHEWTINRPERRRVEASAASMLSSLGSRQDHRGAEEMKNVAEEKGYLGRDPFLTRYQEKAQRPRIKVSVTHGENFPDYGGRCQLYCIVILEEPGRGSVSRLTTPVDTKFWGNPVWNFEDKMVGGWKPGMPLRFEVRNKAIKEGNSLSQMIGCGEDELLGQAMLASNEFYPDSYQGKLEMHDGSGRRKGYIYVDVNSYDGKDKGFCDRFWNALWNGGTQLEELLKELPEMIEAAGKQAQLCIGPEYKLRKPEEKWAAIGPAMLIFVLGYFFLCYVGLFRFHSLVAAFVLIWWILFIIYVIWIFSGNMKPKPQGLPRSVLFGIMLLAAALTYMFAKDGWSYDWAQWWWMFTGHEYEGTADLSAAATVDARSVTFSGGTSWSSVDSNRAAGYRIGKDIYCAAPIMDPTMVAAQIPLINYWAIGINCCDDFASFTCDASRSYKGGVAAALVPKGSLIDGQRGMPCAGCNSEYFRLATLKSVGAFGVVSADEALYVRYVPNMWSLKLEHFESGLWNFIWSGFVTFCIVFLLAWTINFHGWGKPVPTITADDLRRAKANGKSVVEEEVEKLMKWNPRVC